MVIQISTTYAHGSTLKTVEIIMHTAKLLPGKRYFEKKKITCLFRKLQRPILMKLLRNFVYVVEAGRFPTSSPCQLLGSPPSGLKASQKPKSSGCALPCNLDSQGLQVACPGTGPIFPHAVNFNIQECNSYIGDFKMPKQLSFSTWLCWACSLVAELKNTATNMQLRTSKQESILIFC